MKEMVGKVFSIANDNKATYGCTVSKEVSGGENYIAYFSMAEDTDISAEIFSYYKLIIHNLCNIKGFTCYLKKFFIFSIIINYITSP